MTKKAPGKAHRKGLTLLEIADMFRDEDAARDWIAAQRWPQGPYCPYCGSFNVQAGIKHKTMTHRCRDCDNKPMFSLKTGTVMEGSKIKYRAWAVGIYLFTTNLKGISSMKVHREVGIGQKAAWFMLHRLRKAFEEETGPFSGPVEVDEAYFGGLQGNMPKSKRKKLKGGGPAHMTAVVGMKDRETNEVRAEVVADTKKGTLQDFVREHTELGAAVYTDEHRSYVGLDADFDHDTVNHRVGEYVDGMVHTQGIESFWAMLKRAHKGVYHKFSVKHLQRYVHEFEGRHNVRDADTIDQMAGVVTGMNGKRLRYRDLIADTGQSSGARPTT